MNSHHPRSCYKRLVRFGPFTCFIGHNGAGRSNLRDTATVHGCDPLPQDVAWL